MFATFDEIAKSFTFYPTEQQCNKNYEIFITLTDINAHPKTSKYSYEVKITCNTASGYAQSLLKNSSQEETNRASEENEKKEKKRRMETGAIKLIRVTSE